MTEWKTYRLGDLCDTISDTYKGNAKSVVLINTSDVLEGKCLNHTKEPNQNLKGQFKKTFKQYDILYSEIRPANKRFAYIDFDATDYIASTKLMVLRHNEKIEPLYLYYILQSQGVIDELQMLAESRSGTFPQITYSELSRLEVKLPNRVIQKQILGILGAIDDKIENNRRINANLESQAQALYKQWFVDNRSDDWEIKSLSDLMDYQGGSQPPASEFIDKPQDGYVRFVQIRDYASNSHPTYIPIAKKNKLCNKKDIMIARYGASLGRICFGLEGAYNVALAKVKPLENYYREFLRCYLSSNEFYDGINMKGNRAVQAGFNQSDINSFMISCPKQDIFVAFENIVSKILDKRLVLQQENETLATLRDTLLPKLMNGEIKL